MSLGYIKSDEFDIKKFSIKPFNKNSFKSQQSFKIFSSFVNYEGIRGPVKIKLNKFVLKEGGIMPYINRTTNTPFDFFASENCSQRCQMSIPLDTEQEPLKDLKRILQNIDEYIDEHFDEIFGWFKSAECPKNVQGKPTYNELIKPIAIDADGKNKHNYEQVRIKFKNQNKNDDSNEINCDIYKVDKTSISKTGKPSIKPLNVKTISELSKHIGRNSVIGMILTMPNVWIKKPKNRECGLKLVCDQILIYDSGDTVKNEKKFFFDEEGEIEDIEIKEPEDKSSSDSEQEDTESSDHIENEPDDFDIEESDDD